MYNHNVSNWVNKETENQIVLHDVDFSGSYGQRGLESVIDDINMLNEQGYYEFPELRQEYLEEHEYDWLPSVFYSLDYIKTHIYNNEESGKEYYGTVIFKDEQALKDFISGLVWYYNNTDHSIK